LGGGLEGRGEGQKILNFKSPETHIKKKIIKRRNLSHTSTLAEK